MTFNLCNIIILLFSGFSSMNNSDKMTDSVVAGSKKSEMNPKDATKSNPVPGLHTHSPPKLKEYITIEARLRSYINWPTKVKQAPNKLAEAGFFHCGE